MRLTLFFVFQNGGGGERGGAGGCRSGQGAPKGHPYSRPAAPGTFAHAPTAGPQVSLQQVIF